MADRLEGEKPFGTLALGQVVPACACTVAAANWASDSF